MPRKRLLFLHGMALPPEYYTSKYAKEMFDALDKDFDVKFVCSPRKLTSTFIIKYFQEKYPDLDKERMFEWVNSQDHDDGTKTYDGLQDALDFLQEYLLEQPRFDVIAGHSNGSLMAAILSLVIQADPDFLPASKHWSIAMICNGPASFETETRLTKLINEKQRGTGFIIHMPSVHVWGGPTDVTWAGQQKLKEVHFPEEAEVVQHGCGHDFPHDTETVQNIVDALKRSLGMDVD